MYTVQISWCGKAESPAQPHWTQKAVWMSLCDPGTLILPILPEFSLLQLILPWVLLESNMSAEGTSVSVIMRKSVSDYNTQCCQHTLSGTKQAEINMKGKEVSQQQYTAWTQWSGKRVFFYHHLIHLICTWWEKNVNSTQNSACHKCAVGTFGPKEQSGIMYIVNHSPADDCLGLACALLGASMW